MYNLTTLEDGAIIIIRVWQSGSIIMPYLIERVKMATETMKLTISLPKNLATFADEIARERRVSRSKVVSMCLEDERRRQRDELLKEGYLAMAQEYSEFAQLGEELASEILPTWK